LTRHQDSIERHDLSISLVNLTIALLFIDYVQRQTFNYKPLVLSHISHERILHTNKSHFKLRIFPTFDGIRDFLCPNHIAQPIELNYAMLRLNVVFIHMIATRIKVLT
jgi:hypothetical protein